MSVFLDTNVVVYAFDAGAPEKNSVARQVLRDTASEAVISTQVLAEFFWVVTRRLDPPLDPVTAREAAADLATLPVVPTDRSLVSSAIETSIEHHLSLWDALIVEAALAGGCEQLLTEDLGDGQIVRGIEVVNPFVR